MKRKKGKISIVDVNFYSLHKCTQIIYHSIFSILPYTVLVAITYKPLQKHQLLKNWSEKSYFEQFLRGMVGKKRIENPNDIVIRNPGQMRTLISIFILQICRGSSSSELSSPKRCWQNLNFNADMQNEQWTQIENEIYYTLLHLIEWEILSEENDFGFGISIQWQKKELCV